jgi:hypothetical protein
VYNGQYAEVLTKFDMISEISIIDDVEKERRKPELAVIR